MKHFFLIFLILLPTVNALAITPTNLDFGTVQRGDFVERELMVFNNLNENVNIKLTSDSDFITFSENDFSLNITDKKLITIKSEPYLTDGNYSNLIYITELSETQQALNIVNTIAIPDSINIKGGTEIKPSFTNIETVSVSPITGQATGVKVRDNAKWYYLFGLLPIIALVLYLIKTLKNTKKLRIKGNG
ncbi:MAG: hypothetical protein ABIF40_05180 [archaeon]